MKIFYTVSALLVACLAMNEVAIRIHRYMLGNLSGFDLAWTCLALLAGAFILVDFAIAEWES